MTTPDHWLRLTRRVHFGDTDAAGVMHFHQVLRWCHESWEESLQRYGIEAGCIFPGCRGHDPGPEVAMPVVHCEADFRRPVHGGDQLIVWLKPTRLDPSCFEVRSRFELDGVEVATGLIRHLAIDAKTRKRRPLHEEVERWIEASNIGKVLNSH